MLVCVVHVFLPSLWALMLQANHAVVTDMLATSNFSPIVDAIAMSCRLPCAEDRRPADTRPAECRAVNLDEGTKAALCNSALRWIALVFSLEQC